MQIFMSLALKGNQFAHKDEGRTCPETLVEHKAEDLALMRSVIHEV